MESFLSIEELCEAGVVDGYKPEAINATSLDIHLGNTIYVERYVDAQQVIDYRKREQLSVTKIVMDPEIGYVLRPGEFILAHSVEIFHLPDNLDLEYYLKSSMARIGLEHLHSGHCDPGWHGSSLTLELKNLTQWHSIRLRPGDAIGQMIFYKVQSVPRERSYSVRGRYNKDGQTAMGIKV